MKFRFTIRDVLWLTVVVAMGLALALDRMAVATLTKRAEESERHFKELCDQISDEGYSVFLMGGNQLKVNLGKTFPGKNSPLTDNDP